MDVAYRCNQVAIEDVLHGCEWFPFSFQPDYHVREPYVRAIVAMRDGHRRVSYCYVTVTADDVRRNEAQAAFESLVRNKVEAGALACLEEYKHPHGAKVDKAAKVDALPPAP